MLPFPRIVLTLIYRDETFMEDEIGISTWIGPKKVIALGGRCGKKFLFNNSLVEEKHQMHLGALLQSAISSLEPVRKHIVPNVLGWPEATYISIILPSERMSVSFGPQILAQISSFGLSLDIDHRFAIPISIEEEKARKEIAEQYGFDREPQGPNDW